MENSGVKSLSYYMRLLHRYVGFFVVGLSFVYGLSGIVMIYRDTDFLKQDKIVQKQLRPGIKETDLGKALRMKNFEVQKVDGNIVFFKDGTYNKETGAAQYKDKALPAFLEKLSGLHKTVSRNLVHVVGVVYGVLLLFLAISSFWMFKPRTKTFRNGMITVAVGVLFAAAVVLLA